jgi:hypothetical protein
MLATMLGLAGMAAAASAGPECKCRADGQEYSQGQILCIRGKLSRCEMALNNTSWKVIADICPLADLPPKPEPPRSTLPSRGS